MSEVSPKSNPTISEDSPSVISSPELASGVMPSVSPDGPMTDLFGREVAPVRPSPARGKAEGLMTLATSGRLGLDSSESAALQRSLENRLMTRLDTAGSTLFKLTWKGRRTPLGRRYLERAVSVLRTSGKGYTSVPTPQVHDDKTRGNTEADNHHFPHDLSNAAELSYVPTPNAMEGGQTSRGGKRKNELLMGGIAQLATVPTPMAGSPATETYNAAGNNDYSRKIVELASTATPTAEDSQCTGGHRGCHDTLSAQAKASLVSVSSPSARDWKDSPGMSETGVDPDGSTRTRLDQLPRQAQLAASGPTATGGTAETASIGQLNPEYSRWLMGLPIVFSNCADLAMRSFRKSRRNS